MDRALHPRSLWHDTCVGLITIQIIFLYIVYKFRQGQNNFSRQMLLHNLYSSLFAPRNQFVFQFVISVQ